MSEIKRELKKLIPLYCSELDTLEVYMYADYEFSDKYQRNKQKLIRQQSRVYYPFIKTTGRRIISAIIAAALIGSITVAAYEPAREAVWGIFDTIKGTNEYDYVFEDVEQEGKYASGHLLVLPSDKTITIHFREAYPAAAAVTIINAYKDNDTYGTFIIPTYAGAELTHQTTLPAGAYRFYVTPYQGRRTSGSFRVEVSIVDSL